MFFIKKKESTGLGIDIGTKSIRFVEISQKKNNFILENYGEINLDYACRDFFRSFDKNTLNPDIKNIYKSLRPLILEANIKTKKVSFSLPDFSTFFSSFEVPPMSRKEIDSAVNFEARKYIPLPLSEVVLDWQLMDSNNLIDKNSNKVLVMAVSKVAIGQYKEIAEKSDLVLVSLEAEAMALRRALAEKNNNENLCLVEIGFQSTNVSIIKNGFMSASFSFDTAGKDLTNAISESFNVDIVEAEKVKKKYGLIDSEEISLIGALDPVMSIIFEKVKKIINDFEKANDLQVGKILLSGGSSLMPGILEYFNNSINRNVETPIIVEMGEPFKKIIYPQGLKNKMKEINANYAVALGEALRKFDQ